MNRNDYTEYEWYDIAKRHTGIYQSRRPQIVDNGAIKQWCFWYQLPKKFVKAKREALTERSWYALYYKERLRKSAAFAYRVKLYDSGVGDYSGATGYSQGPAKAAEHQRYAMGTWE